MKNVTPDELDELLHDDDKDEVLIDVRTPPEYKGGHIEGAENLPLDGVTDAVERLKGIGTVYVTCGSGARSQQACKELEARGVNVVNVKGGVQAWVREGFDTEGSGKGPIPIIRQVMIVAGSLIVIGAALGFLVNSAWFFLSAFVGAGLLFAGSTGICTMSMILERMPWNR